MSHAIETIEHGAEQGLHKAGSILGGFKERWLANAERTMLENPRYFAWWYTVKSVALVGAIGAAAYYAGQAKALQRGRR